MADMDIEEIKAYAQLALVALGAGQLDDMMPEFVAAVRSRHETIRIMRSVTNHRTLSIGQRAHIAMAVKPAELGGLLCEHLGPCDDDSQRCRVKLIHVKYMSKKYHVGDILRIPYNALEPVDGKI